VLRRRETGLTNFFYRFPDAARCFIMPTDHMICSWQRCVNAVDSKRNEFSDLTDIHGDSFVEFCFG
jgi:hypothetical protein